MITPRIFSSYFYINYITVPKESIYFYYHFSPYVRPINNPLTPVASFLLIILTLEPLDPPVPPLVYTRLSHRPSIIVLNSITISQLPAYRLTDNYIRRIAFSR
jgi:hypothetical protein